MGNFFVKMMANCISVKTREMFAKLKKKIQDEGGISGGEASDKQLSAAIDDGMSTTKSQNLSYVHNSDYQSHRRTNSSSADSEQTSREKSSLGEKPHLAISNEPMDAASREELADLLMRRTHQVKTFEVKLSEMTLLLREKNQQIEKLEAELEKQQDSLCQRLQDLNEQFHSSRAKLSESISSAVKKREEELHLEIQELEKAKTRLEERLVVVEMENDRFFHKVEESKALETTAQEERSRLKSLLLDAQTEVDDYKRILSEKSSDRIEMKDLLHQISMLTEQTNAAERKRQSSDDIAASLRASNERLEKLLKESTSAYAQMALQNSQDDWLEKQIESEREITRLEGEITHFKTELSVKVNQLNEMSKTLSGCQSQIQPLEAKLKTQTLRIQELEQLCEKTNVQLKDALKDKESFRQRSDELSRLCDSLRQSHGESEAKLDSTVKQKEEMISALERQLSDERTALEVTQQKLSELQELKSVEHQVFETEEIARLQEELTETQLALQEKLKIIKKQDQRLMDLKKLLQRELRVTSSANSDQLLLANGSGGGVVQGSGADSLAQAFDSADGPAAPAVFVHSAAVGLGVAAATLPISHSYTHSDARNTKLFSEALENVQRKDLSSGGSSFGVLQRFNPQGIEDDRQYDFTRELNFKYLRHVVLKFMLSRETEAIQLIKAVSMLLNFTKEEQKLIKDTLEWKMSWFGSRPQLPMKGQTAKVIPPSF